MTPKQFDKGVRELFGPVLEPLGFSNEGSQYCTFHRQSSEGVFHFVMPDLGTRGAWYDIKVFPASPTLDPLFSEQFPDDVGIPTDSFSYLSERGVGLDQEKFNCKSVENFTSRFEKTVRGLLEQKAVTYLDQFQKFEDMLPVIKNPMFLAIALHQVGRVDEARPLLEQQRERLARTGSEERSVTVRMQRIDELLQLT